MAQVRLRPGERNRLIGMGSFILLLHVVGWGLLFFLVSPHHYALGQKGVFGAGIGMTVYLLGMRHAVDADHRAAIDNTTRKLMTDGQRPVSVGFWFSLGQSSVVFGLCVLLTLGIRALTGEVRNDDSELHTITGVIGPSVSGTFLAVIAIINLVVLLGIVKIFREMKQGSYDEAALEEQLNSRGFMNRILGRF